MKYGDQAVPYTLPELQRIGRKGFRLGMIAGAVWGLLLGACITTFLQVLGVYEL